jgi:hypothetical protein
MKNAPTTSMKILFLIFASYFLSGCNGARPVTEVQVIEVQPEEVVKPSYNGPTWGIDRTYWQSVIMGEARLIEK